MILNLPSLAKKLEAAISDFTDIAIVGTSGGVDSSVVAAIAVAALGKEQVYLVSMPYDTHDRETFNRRSLELAQSLGTHHLVIDIALATWSLLDAVTQGSSEKAELGGELHRLTLGNTRARMRMAALYALSGELAYRYHQPLYAPGAEQTSDQEKAMHSKGLFKRVRVLGTGNASEDLIGYDTKGGDALADLFVIGDLFKSEVYQLGQHYNLPRSILEAVPSAGLYPGQTDQDELGYSYDELEPALRGLHQALSRGIADGDLKVELTEFQGVDVDKAKFVIERFQANAHKHRAPAVVIVRGSGLVA